MSNENAFEAIRQAIIKCDTGNLEKAITEALDAGIEPMVILEEGVTYAMVEVGAKWEAKEFWLPDVLAAAETVQQGIEFLKARMPESASGSVGKVVIATVKGDIHCVGKNLVATFLRAAGFEVFDLGEDVPADAIINAFEEYGADIIAMSCFATTVAPEMGKVNEMLIEAGMRDKAFTMIGGIAMGPEWVAKVHADAFGVDAYEATQLALAHMKKKKAT